MSAYFVEAVDNALALGGARLLQGVGIMTEQLLVYPGDPADGGHCGELFGLAEHGGGIKLIIQFVISGNYIFRQLVAIGKASFNMPAEGLFKIFFQSGERFCRNDNNASYILGEFTAEILSAPPDVYF